MSAGVHLARRLRNIIGLVGFLNGQRIHIAANQHGWSLVFTIKDADYACFANACCHFQAEGVEFVGDNPSGADLLKGKFRILMQISPPANQFVTHGFGPRHPTYLTTSASW